MVVRKKVVSDHDPIIVTIKREKRDGKSKNKEKTEFREQLKKRTVRKERIEEEWKDIGDNIKKTLEGVRKKTEKVKRKLWDEECRDSIKRESN